MRASVAVCSKAVILLLSSNIFAIAPIECEAFCFVLVLFLVRVDSSFASVEASAFLLCFWFIM